MKANWKERRREYLTGNGRYRDLVREGLAGLAVVESAGGPALGDAVEQFADGKLTGRTTQRVLLNVKEQDRAGGAVRPARVIQFPSNFQ
jgi:hypothetical protein